MFLYIPGGEQLDFFYSITSFLWFSLPSPTPHTLNTWSNPNHHLLNWPKTSTDSRRTKQGIRVSVLLETNYIHYSQILWHYDEILWNVSSNSKFPWNKANFGANSLIPTKVTWPWCYPDSFPFDNSGWGEISSNSPREKQGSLYDTNPNNALHYLREIPQNYHTLALFDSPRKW